MIDAQERLELEWRVMARELAGELPPHAGVSGHRILTSRQAVQEWRVVVGLLSIFG